jgi:hypothetical protein
MPYIFPAEKHTALRLPGTTRLRLRLSMARSEWIQNNLKPLRTNQSPRDDMTKYNLLCIHKNQELENTE